MALKDVKEGRYTANVVDWDVAEVKALDGKPQLLIKFGFENEEGGPEEIWFKGFFQKKDGSPSKKTLDTMLACGYKYKKFSDIAKTDAFDTQKELEITLERDENGYLNVEWVNEPGAGAVAGSLGKEEGAKKLKGLDKELGGELLNARKEHGAEEKKSKKKVKNEATGEEQDAPGFDEDESIPF